MNSVVKLLSLVGFAPVRALLGPIVRLMPRRRNLWVIGSWNGQRFADNAKWLYLWFHADSARAGGVKLIWITKSRAVHSELRGKGLPVERLYSVRGLWASLRAGVHIVDTDSRSTSELASRGALRINLFHGIAWKHVGADIEVPSSLYRRAHHGNALWRAILHALAPWFGERYDLVIASSEANAAVMRAAFPSRRPTLVCGLPRNLALCVDDNRFAREFGFAPPTAPSGRVIVYMPTFRDNARFGRRIPIDWARLDLLLQRYDAEFVLRLHQNDRAALPDLSGWSRIKLHSPAQDPYVLLRTASVLVTDYSSVFFDFLLVNRPVVHFVYDLDEYVQSSRGLYYSLDDVVAGAAVRTSDELLIELDGLLRGVDVHETRRQELRARFHCPDAMSAPATVVEAVHEMTRS